MGEIVKLTVKLTLICAICAGLLSLVSVKTQKARDGIAEQKRREAAQAVLPVSDDPPVRVTLPSGQEIFETHSGTPFHLTGIAMECSSPHGYGGEIRLMVGFTADGEVIDFKVLSASETPGLGAKISSEPFRKGIRGLKTSSNWHVRKDGGDVDAITSATISSRAVCEAIASASAQFPQIKAILCGEKQQ